MSKPNRISLKEVRIGDRIMAITNTSDTRTITVGVVGKREVEKHVTRLLSPHGAAIAYHWADGLNNPVLFRMGQGEPVAEDPNTLWSGELDAEIKRRADLDEAIVESIDATEGH